MIGDSLIKTNRQFVPDPLEKQSTVLFACWLKHHNISPSSYRINFWQHNWTEAGEHCLPDQPRKLGTWLEAVNILLIFQCVYSEVLSYRVERVLGHTGTKFSVGKISGWDKVRGSALRRALKKRSDFVVRSLKRVVNWTVTMEYSEERLEGRKGIFKHKCHRGLREENTAPSPNRDADYPLVRRH